MRLPRPSEMSLQQDRAPVEIFGVEYAYRGARLGAAHKRKVDAGIERKHVRKARIGCIAKLLSVFVVANNTMLNIIIQVEFESADFVRDFVVSEKIFEMAEARRATRQSRECTARCTS